MGPGDHILPRQGFVGIDNYRRLQAIITDLPCVTQVALFDVSGVITDSMGREGLGTAGMVAIMLRIRPVDMYANTEEEPPDRWRFRMSHYDMIFQGKGRMHGRAAHLSGIAEKPISDQIGLVLARCRYYGRQDFDIYKFMTMRQLNRAVGRILFGKNHQIQSCC